LHKSKKIREVEKNISKIRIMEKTLSVSINTFNLKTVKEVIVTINTYKSSDDGVEAFRILM